MARCVIGLIFSSKSPGWEERMFIDVAKEKGNEIVLINLCDTFSELELEKKIRSCSIIYNDTGESLALEIVKTVEALGKRVVECSESFYYSEDKWMFYLKCREKGVPVPETMLLSITITAAKKDLEQFNQWPVILKRIDCCEGNYVEKADNINEAIKIIKRFWKKSDDRVPIIAQEFVKSYCYRLLLIDGKIAQAALRRGHNWKLTGVYSKRFWKFKPDASMIKIAKNIARFTKIKIMGIDMLKKQGRWVVLEVNSEPSFSFFLSESKEMIGKVIDLLVKCAEPISSGKAP